MKEPEVLTKYKNLVVLFAEDNEIVRETVSNSAQLLFEHIYTASNGAEAIELFKKYNVDVVITDMSMPEKDGADLIKYVTSISLSTPIIIATAYDEVTECYSNLPNITVLTKPYSVFDVIEALDSVYEKQHNCDIYSKLEESYKEAKKLLNTLKGVRCDESK